MKKWIALLVLLLALFLACAAWYFFNGGVSHQDIRTAVQSESQTIRNHADSRFDALEKRLDRIEAKLDRLLQLVDRPLPDGLDKASN